MLPECGFGLEVCHVDQCASNMLPIYHIFVSKQTYGFNPQVGYVAPFTSWISETTVFLTEEVKGIILYYHEMAA